MLRAATQKDAKAIADIWNPLIRESEITFTPTQKSVSDINAMIVERAQQGRCFIVAEIDNEVVGFATYAQFRGGIGYALTMEHSVILSDRARGQGIGRNLMRHVEDHARSAGAHSMIAGISSANVAALRFHAALGYAETAVLKEVGRKFDRWYDLHLMQKFL